MGLRSDLSHTKGATFSEDVLKVEIHGPAADLLTIIDVPGIFHDPDPGEGTTTADMDMVKSMVENYIKDDRTIILAVLPSNCDLATQEILQLAKKHDKKGERTIGILTKPDLVRERSAQAVVCDLIEGRRRTLNLGYYLVQNRGADSDPSEASDPEQLQRTTPWSQLPEDRVGVLAVSEALQILLGDITRRAFPQMIAELNRKLKKYNGELDKLGPPRQGEHDQRVFLGRIAGQFQVAVRAALAADYSTDAIFDRDELRLVTQVLNITDDFSDNFRRRAHTRDFDGADLPRALGSCIGTADPPQNSPRFDDDDPFDGKIGRSSPPIPTDVLDRMTAQDFEELCDILTLTDETQGPSGDIGAWISDVYQRSKGMDLGTFNSHLVSTTFTEQSRKWEPLTKVYLSRVVLTIHRFIRDILSSICTDQETYRCIWNEIFGGLEKGYKEAMRQAELLTHVNQREQPWTLNRRFNGTVAKARAERMASLVAPMARKDTVQYGDVQHMVNLKDITQAVKDQSNAAYVQDEIHDILEAYYNLALDRYIDNIFQLSVDHHLLNGPGSPLKVFTQDWVMELDPKRLECIAGEPRNTKNKRSKVKKKLADMETALRVLRQL